LTIAARTISTWK
jgi:hypothetical protein